MINLLYGHDTYPTMNEEIAIFCLPLANENLEGLHPCSSSSCVFDQQYSAAAQHRSALSGCLDLGVQVPRSIALANS